MAEIVKAGKLKCRMSASGEVEKQWRLYFAEDTVIIFNGVSLDPTKKFTIEATVNKSVPGFGTIWSGGDSSDALTKGVGTTTGRGTVT